MLQDWLLPWTNSDLEKNLEFDWAGERLFKLIKETWPFPLTVNVIVTKEPYFPLGHDVLCETDMIRKFRWNLDGFSRVAVLQCVGRAFNRMQAARRKAWLQFVAVHQVIRQVVMTRKRADDFTRTGARTLTQVDEAVDRLKAALRVRLGYQVDVNKRDELSEAVGVMEAAVTEGSKALREERRREPGSGWESDDMSAEVFSVLFGAVQNLIVPLFASRGIEFKKEIDEAGMSRRRFPKDVQWALEELLCYAGLRAKTDTVIKLETKLSEPEREVCFAVSYEDSAAQGSPNKMPVSVLLKPEECWKLTKILVRGMAGRAEARSDSRLEVTLP